MEDKRERVGGWFYGFYILDPQGLVAKHKIRDRETEERVRDTEIRLI